MTMIGVTAKVKIHPGLEQEFERICRELVRNVAEFESGCNFYFVYRSRTEPHVYITMEEFRDKDAIEFHRQSAHIRRLEPMFDGFFAEEPIIEVFESL